MRASFIAIASLAATVSAQNLDELPSCARDCVTQFTSGGNIGNCPSLQAACICSSASFLSDIACCLAGVCSTSDQEKATAFAQTFCKISGVTNLPTAVSCSSTSAASSTSGASSSSTGSVTTTSSSASSTTSAGAQSGTSSISSSAASSATGNTGIQNAAGVGAGIFGGLAAFAAML